MSPYRKLHFVNTYVFVCFWTKQIFGNLFILSFRFCDAAALHTEWVATREASEQAYYYKPVIWLAFVEN